MPIDYPIVCPHCGSIYRYVAALCYQQGSALLPRPRFVSPYELNAYYCGRSVAFEEMAQQLERAE